MRETGTARIEEVLRGAELVEDVVVVPDPAGGRPWAFARPDAGAVREGGFANLYEALRFRLETAASGLPVAARPRGWSIARAPWPREDDGAPDRQALAATLADGPARAWPRDPPDAEPLPPGWERLLRAAGGASGWSGPLTRGVSLEFDLGLDSLERLALILAVAEALGREVGERETATLLTLGDLVDRFGAEAAEQAAGPPRARRGLVVPAQARPPVPRLCRPPRLAWPLVYAARTGMRRWAARKLGVRLEGLERVDWDRRPLIVAQNHQASIDAFLLGTHLPARIQRQLVFVGYGPYFQRGAGRLAARLFHVQPIDADALALEGLRAVAAAVRRGRILVIYPEGERSWDGRLQELRRGVVWLAAATGAWVVPSAIDGTFQASPRGWSGFHPHPVRIAFGPALPPPDPADGAAGERHFLARLREDIAALMRAIGADPDDGDPRTWADGPSARREAPALRGDG
jgi:long-chain acyl-CoA synthetase